MTQRYKVFSNPPNVLCKKHTNNNEFNVCLRKSYTIMLFFGKKAVTLHRDLKTTPITYNNIMYTYKYPHPAVTTDCVVFGFDGNSLSLLLIKRGIEPYKGTWALPGGFMNMDETAEQGALRELQEETGVKDIYIEQLQAFTGVDRDPRERVLTIAFLAFVRQEKYEVIAGDDAAQAQWFPISELPELAFDHKEIIRVALEKLRWKITYEPLAFRLLNKTFTMTQVQTIYEVVLGQTFDRRNFHKKMTALGYIVPTDQQIRNNGRPGTLYTFDEEKYREQIENRNAF